MSSILRTRAIPIKSCAKPRETRETNPLITIVFGTIPLRLIVFRSALLLLGNRLISVVYWPGPDLFPVPPAVPAFFPRSRPSELYGVKGLFSVVKGLLSGVKGPHSEQSVYFLVSRVHFLSKVSTF